VKLPEFLQTSYRKVVVQLLCPVLAIWLVQPLDEVQDAVPLLGAPMDLVNIAFLALSDVVGLSEDLQGVRLHPVFTGWVGFEQRHMEDIVDHPFPRQGEPNSKGQDNLFYLEGTMILVVQLLEGSARFDIASVEHHQVPNLVLRGLDSLGVRITAYLFVSRF